jgi:hypothetical protein
MTSTLPASMKVHLSRMCLKTTDTPLPALSPTTLRNPSGKISKIFALAMTPLDSTCLKIKNRSLSMFSLTTLRGPFGKTLKNLAPTRACLRTDSIPLLALPSRRLPSSSLRICDVARSSTGMKGFAVSTRVSRYTRNVQFAFRAKYQVSPGAREFYASLFGSSRGMLRSIAHSRDKLVQPLSWPGPRNAHRP